MSGSHLSKDLFELVKSIGESKSKQEEDRIILEEISALKKKLHDPSLSKKKSKEFVVRMLYVEMLGHDASFGYIKAIELCASTSLIPKKCGYLVSALCLSPEHEFRFMLVNQMQRDMGSANHLEVCAGLSGVARLVTADMIPAVLNDVRKALTHEHEAVRKKAVMALHRFRQLDPDALAHLGDAIRRTLCDRDPAVMGAALCLFHDLVRARPADYKDLVASFVSILKQVVEHRLPRDYDYHRMPAPWIQMRLLRVLALLGYGDQVASEGMYEVLLEVMRRADSGINVGYALVYEGVRTVTRIYPNATLLDAAAASIGRFLSSENHNLKYVGVTGLALIVKDHPKYALDHQMAVVDCLEDPDETLKRKTLDLLYRMTNGTNVEFVVGKLLAALGEAGQVADAHWRRDLAGRVAQLAERFAPGNAWYVRTMARVFEVAGDLVGPAAAQTVMQLVAEGGGNGDDEEDDQVRADAVDNFVALAGQPVLPDRLARTAAWVLGEYGYLASGPSQPDLVDLLCALAERRFQDPSTRGVCVTAVMKLCAQTGTLPPAAARLVEAYSCSVQVDLQQRCREFAALLRHPQAMVDALPVDASCEDVEVDAALPFLDGFVQAALAAGAVPYCPPAGSDDDDDDDADGPGRNGGRAGGLRFEAYRRPTDPALANLPPMTTVDDLAAAGGAAAAAPGGGGGGGGLGAGEDFLKQAALAGPAAPGAKVWGRPDPSAAAAAAEPSLPTSGTSTPGGGAAPPGPAAAAAGSAAPKFPSRRPPSGLGLSAPAGGPAETKTPEQLEKERTAAALFGGLGGLAPTPAPAASQPRVRPRPVPVPAPAAAAAAAVPAAVPAAAIDLLDLGFDGPAPPAVPLDLRPAAAAAAPPPPPQAHAPPQPDAAVPAPAPPPAPEDPFAALEALAPTPSSGTMPAQPLLSSSAAYNYHGHKLSPLLVTTPEFGQLWGSTRHERKVTVTNSSAATTSAFMATISQIGAHPIETIEQTQEAIAGGEIKDLGVKCLIHSKLNAVSRSIDVTVKTADALVSENLAYFLQQKLG